jgi:hypothetical protein
MAADAEELSGALVQVLFAECRPAAVMLDLVALEPVSVGEAVFPRGTPFTISMQVTSGLAGFISAVTDHWTHSGEIVGLAIEVHGPQVTVRLDSRGEQLVLDVVEASPGPLGGR